MCGDGPAVAVGFAVPAGASTLIRQGLDDLVADNGTIVVGEVVDTQSYWNAEGTFILTDVRIAPFDVLKGDAGRGEITITIPGGTVGELTTVIVGGASLARGNSYLLFLDEGGVPGVEKVRTVRHLGQGVFEIKMVDDGLRAFSQATRHPLMPDARGQVEAPGGAAGLPLGTLIQTIRELADRPQGVRKEVK